MRILLVNDLATPTGGAEVGILTLRDGLRERGHDARLFSSAARPLGVAALADYQCYGTLSRMRGLLQVANPWAYRGLRRILAEFRPDVVHVEMFLTQLSPSILPLLKNVPALYHVVWYRPICPLGTKALPDGGLCAARAGAVCYRSGCLPLYKWLPLMLQMALWRRRRTAFNAIVTNSDAMKRRLLGEGFEAVEVIPNGVPVRPMRPPLSGPPVVVFAGRLVREKGAAVLIEAFARVRERVPEARLFLAGDGPERGSLAGLIASRGLSSRVSLLGHLSRPEMESRFAGAWVQAVPSLWEEPFGLVAAESMMRGTAVVASRAGGLAEIVQDRRSGLLVPPGDVDALAGALLELLQSPDRADAMGRAGREVALARFSQSAYVEQFIRLYERLSGNGGQG